MKTIIRSALYAFLLICLSGAIMLTAQSCSSPTAPEEVEMTNERDALAAELDRRRADGRDPFGLICFGWFDHTGQYHFKCTFVAVGDDI